MYVGAGVLFLLSPKFYDYGMIKAELTSALIAICVLILVAGGLTLTMSAIDFFAKKESK